jgi:hypothetical protein
LAPIHRKSFPYCTPKHIFRYSVSYQIFSGWQKFGLDLECDPGPFYFDDYIV